MQIYEKCLEKNLNKYKYIKMCMYISKDAMILGKPRNLCTSHFTKGAVWQMLLSVVVDEMKYQV